MKFIDLLQTARRGLRRSRARTLLTISAIFIGAMTLTLTNGIGSGVKSYLSRQASELGAINVLQIMPSVSVAAGGNAGDGPASYNPNRKVSAQGIALMDAHDIAVIKAIPNISEVVPAYIFSPDYIMGNGGKYELNTVVTRAGDNKASMEAGKLVDNNSPEDQIVLPDTYVSDMGYGNASALIGKTVTIGITNEEGRQSTVNATVVGVQPKVLFGDQAATVNTTLAQQLYDLQSVGLSPARMNQFNSLMAVFPNNLSAQQIQAIKDTLHNKGYNAQTLQDTKHTAFTIINVAIIVLDVFAGITLIAASFGIINTLYMSVQERTKEIGLMKALGMSEGKVFTLFSIEATLIGFWGSALGVVAAASIGKAINTIARNSFLKDVPGLTLLTFPVTTILGVIVGIMLLAFLAGTLPALRASRKNPIEALRYE